MAESRFGEEIRSGDLDRDGYSDLVVTEPVYNEKRGAVRVYRGGPRGLGTVPDWSLVGATPGEHLGRGIEVLDTDWDGWPDLVVVSDGKEADGIPNSNLRLVRGSPEGWKVPHTSAWTGRQDELDLARLPLAVMDVNADGHPDLLCAGLLPGPERFPVHCVFALCSGPSGLSREARWRVLEHGLGNEFGFSRIDAGDLDGDGYRDLLVSALSYPDRESSVGRVFLFRGGKDGVSKIPSLVLDYPLSTRRGVDAPGGHLFGYAMAGIGDANGDGIGDVVIAAPYADHDDIDEGAVFIHFGSRTGLSPRPAVVLEADKEFTVLGYSLAAAGDVDRDGYADFVVGAPTVTTDQPQEGAVVLYPGAKGNTWGRPRWARTSDHSHWRVGYRVVTGDFNGDGYTDVASTAHNPGASAAVLVWSLDPRNLASSLAWSPGKSWARWIEQRWNWSPVWKRFLAMIGLGSALIGPIVLVVWQFRRVRNLRDEAADLAVHQERLRIARDLHDELGAPMHRLHGTAGSADAAEMAREVVTGIERVIWSVHPERRSLEDLACGLMDLAENVLRDTTIRKRFEFPEDLPAEELSAEALGAVYRSAQEALNNVRKHSGAGEVGLAMTVDQVAVQVVIFDDGTGDADRPDGRLENSDRGIGNGHGRRNMAARMGEVGGACAWETAKPRGLRVVLRVPRNGASTR